MRASDDCILKSNEEFLVLLEDFRSSADHREKLKALCRLSGYLRYLFFEILEENVQNAVGGDLGTLICGIPLVISSGIDLCEGSGEEERDSICGVILDSLSLALALVRKLGRDDGILELIGQIQARLYERPEIDGDILPMLKDFLESFIRSFG
ncbi:MAG: hypothetical protein BA066_05675 [Candidatus Korarchaeota archaeon NZ13-K]|nr:MAG: hypothetical protein BA066_05675 [Candidatus Korarchaeota archaeon NZ13-K]